MAIITGTLVDVGLDPVTARYPELVWVPSAPTTTLNGQLVTAVPVETIPSSNGTWTAELISTNETSPPITYSLRIRLLDPASGYVWMDFPDWKISVPWEGGNLSDLIGAPLATGVVWEVEGDTVPESARAGDLLLNTLTSDLYRIG